MEVWEGKKKVNVTQIERPLLRRANLSSAKSILIKCVTSMGASLPNRASPRIPIATAASLHYCSTNDKPSLDVLYKKTMSLLKRTFVNVRVPEKFFEERNLACIDCSAP